MEGITELAISKPQKSMTMLDITLYISNAFPLNFFPKLDF